MLSLEFNEKVQSDSTSLHKDSMKLFFAMAEIIGVETLSSLAITAALLQTETLKIDGLLILQRI